MHKNDPRRTDLATVLASLGVAIAALTFYFQLLEWKKQGHDYMPVVLSLILILATVTINLTAAYFNWRAGRRRRVATVTLRDDYRAHMDTQNRMHMKAIADVRAELREACGKEKAAIETKWTIKSSSAYGMLEQQYDEQIRHLQEQHEAEIEQLKNHYFNERDRRI